MLEQSVLKHPLINDSYDAIKTRYQLTKKEFEVVKCLSIFGQNNNDLGTTLNVTEKTMKNHIANIFFKTKTRSSRELQALVLRETTQSMLENILHISDTSIKYCFQQPESTRNKTHIS